MKTGNPLNTRRRGPSANTPRATVRDYAAGKLRIFGINISKKFVAMLLGVAAPFVAAKLGIDELLIKDALNQVWAVVVAYLVAQGAADTMERKGAIAAEIAARAEADAAAATEQDWIPSGISTADLHQPQPPARPPYDEIPS